MMARLTVGVLLLSVAAHWCATLTLNRDLIFDDSFITYRYAENLAAGHGLVWNRGEAPTEGYTSLAFILALAPFSALGLPLLWVSRTLSVASALGVAVTLYREARQYTLRTRVVAVVPGAVFLLDNRTALVSALGMETMLFAVVLLQACLTGARAVRTSDKNYLLKFGGWVVAASIVRPEGLLLVGSYLASLFLGASKIRPRLSLLGGSAKTLVVSVAIPVGVYCVWKWLYFGSILPNPFHIKVGLGNGSLFSDLGLMSVLGFARHNWHLLLMACTFFPLATGRRGEGLFVVCSLLAFLLFFACVDTLMDEHNRFLVPFSGLVLWLCSPAIVMCGERLLDFRMARPVGQVLFVVALVCVIGLSNGRRILQTVYAAGRGVNPFAGSVSVMQREYQIARRLGGFAGIEGVRVACGDAGVIPYISRCLHLDLVGLNDNFIARERDLGKLVDYFFSKEAELVLLPAVRGGTWISFGHGPLGNYLRWSGDARWSRYEYAGTVLTDGLYDLHVLVKGGEHLGGRLWRYVRSAVVDGWYERIPARLGCGPVARDDAGAWVWGPVSGE